MTDNEVPEPEEGIVDRDWFNDPVFLRSIIHRIFTYLPDDLDGVFEEDVSKEAQELLVSHVTYLYSVDQDMGFGTELEDEEDDEEDELEDELEDEEEDESFTNPRAGAR